MTWSLAAAAVAGLALGVRYRAPALLVVTAVVLMVGSVAGGTRDVVRYAILPAAILQLAYLCGVGVSLLWHRSRSRRK